MGKAKCLELKGQLQAAVQLLTEIWVKFQAFVPALMERAKLQLRLGAWDQVCLA